MVSTVGLNAGNLQDAVGVVESSAPLLHPDAPTVAESEAEALIPSTATQSKEGFIGCTPTATKTHKRKERDELELIPIDSCTELHARTPTPEAEVVEQQPKAKKAKISKTGIKNSAMPVSVRSVTMQDLHEFISHISSLPQPVVLTHIQKKAIADLKTSIATELPEPDLGDGDYVSALGLFKDRPQGRGIVYSFQDSPDNGPDSAQSKWCCTCNIKVPGITDSADFPREDEGFVVVDEKGGRKAPSFARKKDAKRYAAKCVVDWLRKQGKDIKVPKLISNGGQQPASELALPAENKPTSAQLPTPAGLPTTTTTTTTTKEANAPADNSDDEVSAVDRVKELCVHLGMQNPSYKIVESEPGSSIFYNGYADFGVDHISFGTERFEVKNCFTKKGAKEQIAEQALRWLIVEKKRRDDQNAALLGNTDSEMDVGHDGASVSDTQEQADKHDQTDVREHAN